MSPTRPCVAGRSRWEGLAFARFEVEEGSGIEEEEAGWNGLPIEVVSGAGAVEGAEEDREDADSLESSLGGEFEESEMAASRAEPFSHHPKLDQLGLSTCIVPHSSVTPAFSLEGRRRTRQRYPCNLVMGSLKERIRVDSPSLISSLV